jgi:hypothetical protein
MQDVVAGRLRFGVQRRQLGAVRIADLSQGPIPGRDGLASRDELLDCDALHHPRPARTKALGCRFATSVPLASCAPVRVPSSRPAARIS